MEMGNNRKSQYAQLLATHMNNSYILKKMLMRIVDLGSSGITLQQHYILEYLVVHGGRSIDEIATALKRARPTITQILQRMADNCLVRRVKHPGDRWELQNYFSTISVMKNSIYY